MDVVTEWFLRIRGRSRSGESDPSTDDEEIVEVIEFVAKDSLADFYLYVTGQDGGDESKSETVSTADTEAPVMTPSFSQIMATIVSTSPRTNESSEDEAQ